VQEVLKSIDVVSASKLNEAGVTRITDLSRVSPSITGTLPIVTRRPSHELAIDILLEQPTIIRAARPAS
jgi:hypothetical protein